MPGQYPPPFSLSNSQKMASVFILSFYPLQCLILKFVEVGNFFECGSVPLANYSNFTIKKR